MPDPFVSTPSSDSTVAAKSPSEPPVPPPPSAEPPEPRHGRHARPPRRGRGALVAVLLVATVALAATAGVMVVRDGDPSPRAPVAAQPSPSEAPTVAPPEDLAAEAGAFSVTVTWTDAGDGAPAEGYEIYRNDSLLESVEPDTTSYTDETVLPGRRYTYRVEARGDDAESATASVEVRTEIPPMSEARVVGDFNVVFRVVSQSGFTSYPETFTKGWAFRPRCRSGPCPVVWRDLGEESLRTTLRRSGATYSGSDTGNFNARCGDSPVTSSLAIEFKVTKAKAEAGEWVARRLVGTLEESEAAQLGCVASSATLSFTATLLD